MTQKSIFLHPSNTNQMVVGRSGTTVLCEVSFAVAWSSGTYGNAYNFLRGTTPSGYYRTDGPNDVAIDMTFSKKLKFITYSVIKNATNYLSSISIYDGTTLVATFDETASSTINLNLNGVIGNRIVVKPGTGSNAGYPPYANLFNGLVIDDDVSTPINNTTDIKIGGDMPGTPDSQLAADGWVMFPPSFSSKILSTDGTREKVYVNTTWTGWITKMPCFNGYSDSGTSIVNGMTSTSGSYIQKTWDHPSGYYMFLYGFRDNGSNGFISVNNVVVDTCPGNVFKAVKIYVGTGDIVRIGEPAATIFSFAGYYPMTIYPSSPPITSPTIGVKNFGDKVNLTWNPVSVPTQPAGSPPLDINKVFYEVYYLADGVNSMLLVDGLDVTTYEAKIIAGGSSSSKFAIRSYVLIQGSKYYSSYAYTNTFTTNPPPSNAVFPNSLLFSGNNSYLTAGGRVIPTSGPWTLEFSIKTTQINGNILSIDNGTTSVLLCQLNNGMLVNTINGNGGSVTVVNDGKIHHVAIVSDGTTVKTYVDGVYKTTNSTAVPVSVASIYLGTSYYSGATSIPLYNGVLTLPRFWNMVRTPQQLLDYKNKIVPDNEPGLIDYMTFDPSTGLVKFKKNSYSILSSNSGLSWITLFLPLSDTIIPYPNQFQRKENLEYLRDKTNEFRTNNGLNPIVWTDPIIVKSMTVIKAVHWNEIGTGIVDVYSNTGQLISSSGVENKLKETILPRNDNFPISELIGRINNIVKGLKNE